MSVFVNNISKQFENQMAVNQLSFAVKEGEILGFLGPNGAGKTTTMKMICGYLVPDQGQISVCGHDAAHQSLLARKNIGYLAEHNPLYSEMYVLEFLEFMANIHKIENKKHRIDEVISLTGLTAEYKKRIGNLSKGYRQRVGLAQAIIHDPQVLILDEPTSGLDMNQLVDIRNLIKQLGSKKSVIFSSHIMHEVQSICDRVVIIHQGVLVADERIEDLQHKISGRHTIKLVLKESGVSTDLFKSLKMDINISKFDHTFIIDHHPDAEITGKIYELMVKNNLTILEMTPQKNTIESIFQQLTKHPSHV